MKNQHPVEKSVVLRTKDFFAESERNDGLCFRVDFKWSNDGAGKWWLEHWLDNERQVFRSLDADEVSLFCADETEATVLLQQLQLEYSGVHT